MAQILFVNASQNARGNTVQLGRQLLANLEYEQLNLRDYKIYQLGQQYPDDQFDLVYQRLAAAPTIIFGTPVYWHNMSGYLKTLIERLSQKRGANELAGHQLGVLIQGMDPRDAIQPVTAIIRRFCQVGELKYLGTADNVAGYSQLRERLLN